MDYRKLNNATRESHFPLPFIYHTLDRLDGKEFYYFLYGYLGYNQIDIALKDRDKIAFTCSYGTFAFRRRSLGLCNYPTTFKRCMMSIFSYLIKCYMEVFMDDFSVFGESFKDFLDNLEMVLT